MALLVLLELVPVNGIGSRLLLLNNIPNTELLVIMPPSGLMRGQIRRLELDIFFTAITAKRILIIRKQIMVTPSHLTILLVLP